MSELSIRKLCIAVARHSTSRYFTSTNYLFRESNPQSKKKICVTSMLNCAAARPPKVLSFCVWVREKAVTPSKVTNKMCNALTYYLSKKAYRIFLAYKQLCMVVDNFESIIINDTLQQCKA